MGGGGVLATIGLVSLLIDGAKAISRAFSNPGNNITKNQTTTVTTEISLALEDSVKLPDVTSGFCYGVDSRDRNWKWCTPGMTADEAEVWVCIHSGHSITSTAKASCLVDAQNGTYTP